MTRVLLALLLALQLPQTPDQLNTWLEARIKPLAPRAVSPMPGEAAADVTALEWSALGAARCDVFLGTVSNPPLLAADVPCGGYVVALVPATKYYWKVVAKNTAGTMTGPTWSFTTATQPELLDLTIVVLDAAAVPIVGAKVTAFGTNLPPPAQSPRTTDGSGFVHFPVYGSTQFRIEASGFVTREVDLPPGNHRVHLERAVPVFFPRAGPVRLCGRAFCDDNGPFNALGFSYMHGASTADVDPAGFDADMATMQAAGASYARMICLLDGGSIQPDPWVHAGNTDAARCVRAIDRAWDKFGIRTEVTLFGGLRHWTSASARRAAVDELLALLQPRLDRVLGVEVTNEHWINWTGKFGATIAEARDLAAVVRQRLGPAIPIAISALVGVADDGTVTEAQFYAEARAVYAGSAATIWTPHYSRRTNTVDGIWRAYRQPWDNTISDPSGVPLTPAASINNEPIGQESSGAQDGDPDRQVLGMVLSFAAGGGAYVYHSDSGIWSDRLLAEYQTPHKGVFKRLTSHPTAAQIFRGFAGAILELPPDLATWSRSRHLQAEHPFAPSFALVNGLTTQIWPDGITAYGVVRAYAATRGSNWIVTLLGIKDRFEATCARASTFRVIRPSTWTVVGTFTCTAGQTIPIRQALTPEAVVIGHYQ